jgi:Effector-associated domain 1/Trypsin-like peptidase domain
MELNGPQRQQLHAALQSAYPDTDRLALMLSIRCDRRLADISAPGPLPIVVLHVIEAAQAEGWLAALISGARESNPGNPNLAGAGPPFSPAVVTPPLVGLAVVTPPGPQLQLLINQQQGFLNPSTWRERLALLEGQVCQISYPTAKGTLSGTGCLVAPDLVLTNEHVITPLREDPTLVGQVEVRFDYKALDDGTVVSPGVPFQLDPNGWLVDWSPPSAVDVLLDQGGAVPGGEELDYALLRVAGEPGNQTLGVADDPLGPTRGWVTELAPDVAANTFLFILQHPLGKPIAMAGDVVTAINGNATRIRYKTNTEHGSSGAPCFDINWRLAALHHLGDPGYAALKRSDYNEGVPMQAILGLLEQRQQRPQLFPART